MNISQYAGQIGRLDYPGKVGLPWSYFEVRGCFLDCRGPGRIVQAPDLPGVLADVHRAPRRVSKRFTASQASGSSSRPRI